MSDYFRRLSKSVGFLLAITIILLIVISITSYQLFKDNSTKTNIIATESIKENAKILIKQLDESLENKIEIIFSILTLISNSPVIKSDSVVTMNLLESAQNSTKDLTAYYGWSDFDGKIKLTTGFEDRQTYEKFIGKNVSFIEQFQNIKKTLLPEFTPIIQSLIKVPTLFIVHPIIVTNSEGNFSKIILDLFPKYNAQNLFESLKSLERMEKPISSKHFEGTVYAGINVSSMVDLLGNQVSPRSKSSISLLDENGNIIYSDYKGLDTIIFDFKESNDLIKTQFNEENQILLSQIKGKIISGKTESLDISYVNGSKFTISYTPITINNKDVFYLVLDTPHVFAREVDSLISQQQNSAIGFIILTSVIGLLVIILLNLLNYKLKKTVSERTQELKMAVKNLEENNQIQKEFINVAAHELRTPTQSIAGYCEMIELFPENINKYLEPIKRNVERLSILINNILDVTRIESKNFRLERSYFDINIKINNVIKDIKLNYNFDRNKSIEIVFNSSSKPNMIFADKTKMYQAINNLLTNAIKFTDKGKITITLENKLINNKKYVVVKIKDMGKGIDQEILHKMFDKFTTKSDTGTGLGLYITKKIIEMHGGTLKGYNNVDEIGATFEFTIPIEKEDRN